MIAGVVTYVVTINYSDTRGERPRFGPWLILSLIILLRTLIMHSLNAICSTTRILDTHQISGLGCFGPGMLIGAVIALETGTEDSGIFMSPEGSIPPSKFNPSMPSWRSP